MKINKSLSTVEALIAAQSEVRRLAPFEHWVRQFGVHADFCPAREKGREAACTCALTELWKSAHKK